MITKKIAHMNDIIIQKSREFIENNKQTLDDIKSNIFPLTGHPISLKDISYDINSIDILILTATPDETNIVRTKIKKPEYVNKGARLYTVGKMGLYNVVHVESAAGSGEIDASEDTTIAAIDIWEPKMIISVGIAYGINIDKHNLGDVVFAAQAITYSGAKISDSQIVLSKNLWIPSPDSYLKRLIKVFSQFEHGFSLHSGSIITGENVIDDDNFKNKLVEAVKALRPVGGEMESYGIYKAAHKKKIQYCFMLKGICDWGTGKNSIPKEQQKDVQLLAANNATSVVFHLLSNALYFEEIGLLTTENYYTLLDISDQFVQHQDLVDAIKHVKEIYNHYKELYKLYSNEFLDELVKYGYCDKNFDLTDKGILLLFSLPEFDPYVRYRKKAK